MDLDIIKIDYYRLIIDGQITSASKMLSTIVGAGVDFHAFKAIPVKPDQTQFTLFAKDSSKLTQGAQTFGLRIDGPSPALLIKGDEKSGALADIYKQLSQAGIQVEEACGIADINAGYGVILYLSEKDCDKALAVLNR